MIHTHLRAAPHANDGVDRLHFVEPDIHDAHLDFGRTRRRLDHRDEIHALLQQILASLRGGTAAISSCGGTHHHPSPANE
jgi:hypothetical protein